ncbi:hypothetical protein MAN_06093, partial [Metarhizium hybridum]
MLQQIDFSHLPDRCPAVIEELVGPFSDAINLPNHGSPPERCFWKNQDDTPLEVLAGDYVEKVFSHHFDLDPASGIEFISRARDFCKKKQRDGMGRLFSTFLRLASCLPYQHHGHTFLVGILKKFLLTNESTEQNWAEAYEMALMGEWPYSPWSAHSSKPISYRLDEWVNLNAFVSIIYRDLGQFLDDQLCRGLEGSARRYLASYGVGAMNAVIPQLANEGDERHHATFKALVACAWINHGGERLASLKLAMEQGRVPENTINFSDENGNTSHWNEAKWKLMVDGLEHLIKLIPYDRAREHTQHMLKYMKGQVEGRRGRT